MNVFDETPTYGIELEQSHKLTANEFGDGYTQRIPEGIHAQRRRWSVAFNAVTSAKAARILAFLRAQGGVNPFLWVPPAPDDSEPVSVVCEFPFQHTKRAFDNETVTVSFMEDFNPCARVATPDPEATAVGVATGTLTVTCATAGATLRYQFGAITAAAVTLASPIWDPAAQIVARGNYNFRGFKSGSLASLNATITF